MARQEDFGLAGSVWATGRPEVKNLAAFGGGAAAGRSFEDAVSRGEYFDYG